MLVYRAVIVKIVETIAYLDENTARRIFLHPSRATFDHVARSKSTICTRHEPPLSLLPPFNPRTKKGKKQFAKNFSWKFSVSKIHSPLPSLQNSHEGIINHPPRPVNLTHSHHPSTSIPPPNRSSLRAEPSPFEALFHSLLPIPSIRIVQFQVWCNTDGARAKRHKSDSTAAV